MVAVSPLGVTAGYYIPMSIIIAWSPDEFEVFEVSSVRNQAPITLFIYVGAPMFCTEADNPPARTARGLVQTGRFS